MDKENEERQEKSAAETGHPEADSRTEAEDISEKAADEAAFSAPKDTATGAGEETSQEQELSPEELNEMDEKAKKAAEEMDEQMREATAETEETDACEDEDVMQAEFGMEEKTGEGETATEFKMRTEEGWQELREDVEALRRDLNDILDRARLRGQDTVEDARNRLKASATRLEETAERQVKNFFQQCTDTVDRTYNNVRESIAARPFNAVLIAFLGGMITASFLKKKN